MPSWNDILSELKSLRIKSQTTIGSEFDVIRRQYLNKLHEKTGRNIIVYYSGWLQKPKMDDLEITDGDKNGFMNAVHGLDTSKGLDLLLHTPGGGMAATESIVEYLREMFGTNIRAIIPQIALSAGTMIACSCNSIVMGKQSSLGPIDPQFDGGMSAHGILEEFEQAFQEISKDDAKIHVWQPIIANYSPTLIGDAQKAILWANEMVKEWLVSGMLKDVVDASNKADEIVSEIGDHALTKSHARHLSAKRCKEMGLIVDMLEEDQDLQDAVLSVHHACMHTLSATGAFKIIENHLGKAYVRLTQMVPVISGTRQIPPIPLSRTSEL